MQELVIERDARYEALYGKLMKKDEDVKDEDDVKKKDDLEVVAH